MDVIFTTDEIPRPIYTSLIYYYLEIMKYIYNK